MAPHRTIDAMRARARAGMLCRTDLESRHDGAEMLFDLADEEALVRSVVSSVGAAPERCG